MNRESPTPRDLVSLSIHWIDFAIYDFLNSMCDGIGRICQSWSIMLHMMHHITNVIAASILKICKF